LVIAAHSGQGALAAFLLERGADPNAAAAGYTALHGAVLMGDLPLVKALLGHGANPNAVLLKGTPSRYYSKDYALRDVFIGATPLWLAARFGESGIMRVLVAGGADPRFIFPERKGVRENVFGEAASIYGSTILTAALAGARGFGAFRAGDRRERYEGPGDVAAKSDGEDERLALATAATALDLGADVNAAGADGNTPLHIAAALGLRTVIPLLVESGARFDAKNKPGQTPLAMVKGISPQRGALYGLAADQQQDTIALLQKLGAAE
jgi:ankyrin repeat protein